MSTTPPTIPNGTATNAGLAGAAAAFVGAVVAATQGLTTESVTGAALAGVALLTVLGGRYAQAVAAARKVAKAIEPIVDAIAADDLTDEADQYAPVPIGELETREQHTKLGDDAPEDLI